MTPHLPPELWHELIEQCRRTSLVSLSRVSKELQEIAEVWLYRVLPPSEYDQDDDSSNEKDANMVLERCLLTILERPTLAAHVRQIHVLSVPQTTLLNAIRHTLPLFHNLRALSLPSFASTFPYQNPLHFPLTQLGCTWSNSGGVGFWTWLATQKEMQVLWLTPPDDVMGYRKNDLSIPSGLPPIVLPTLRHISIPSSLAAAFLPQHPTLLSLSSTAAFMHTNISTSYEALKMQNEPSMITALAIQLSGGTGLLKDLTQISEIISTLPMLCVLSIESIKENVIKIHTVSPFPLVISVLPIMTFCCLNHARLCRICAHA